MGVVKIGSEDRPLICTSLVSRNNDAIWAELKHVLTKKPDVIEWRADFYDGIADSGAVFEVARRIKEIAVDTAAIFTVRSKQEGGESIPLSDSEVLLLNEGICRSSGFEYVDCELRNDPQGISHLRTVASAAGKKIIGSYHNFDHTPDEQFLLDRIAAAERFQLDVAKIAVMPKGLEDLLVLLGVTLQAKKIANIPLITMSMGRYGAISRIVGGVFGSSLTFAVGQSSSAPGQIPIDELRTVLEVINRAVKEA